MAHITKVGGEHNLYHVHFLDQRTDPGYGQGGGGVDPGYGRPEGGRPGHDLPGGGLHPGNRPPGSAGGGIPDNSLPGEKPPMIAAGYLLVLARGQDGKWHYAAVPAATLPKPLPEPLPPDAATKPINPDEAPPAGSTAPPIAGPT
jgi:hypothetical protein